MRAITHARKMAIDRKLAYFELLMSRWSIETLTFIMGICPNSRRCGYIDVVVYIWRASSRQPCCLRKGKQEDDRCSDFLFITIEGWLEQVDIFVVKYVVEGARLNSLFRSMLS